MVVVRTAAASTPVTETNSPVAAAVMGNNNKTMTTTSTSTPTAPTSTTTTNTTTESLPTKKLSDLAKWVPLRLTSPERALLAVLEQSLHVSEYTDHVDVTTSSVSVAARRNGGIKARRILDGILEACHIATGLVVSSSSFGEKGGEKQTMTAMLCQQQDASLAAAAASTTTTTTTATATRLDSHAKKKKKLQKKLKKLQKKKKSKKGKQQVLDALQQLEQQQQQQQDVEPNESNNNNNMEHEMTRGSKSNGNNNNSSSWASRDPADNAILFQTMFEIGRRNKVLNPAAMRTTYGKLMYLLQDAQNPTVAKSLGFSLHKDLMLVGPFLKEHDCGDLLEDPRLECAVQFISDRDVVTGERLERTHVQAMVEGKRQVTEQLVEQYSQCSKLTADDIRRAIESLADAVAYIESNVRPVQRMLQYLEDNFDPNQPVKGFSLTLRGGSRGFSSSSSSNYYSRYGSYGYSAYSSGSSDGPTLSHSHSEQFTFVWQSLRLWCKVMQHMHRLWVCADDDLLSTTSTYHLYNTGQGLNRVQNCPRVRKVMSNLLAQTQQETGKAWVGLSVIHLGDRDVPNALIFIDKYTQIPRFLSPIVNFLESLPELCQDERIHNYIKDQFGSAELLKLTVLADYFKHGFDGSGDDGGSCIDGRLTSSWNWTSRVAKKQYYHAFMLSGFQGFDGDFR